MRWTLIAFVMIAGCGEVKKEASAPADILGAEAQQARYQRCESASAEFRSSGAWVAGGAKPIVDATKFKQLSSEDKQKLADTAACLGKGGQVSAPVAVQIMEPGLSAPVITIQGYNAE